jgi:hypothetical protein
MKYQLVLQFSETLMEDFDAVLDFEEDLISELTESAEVDGHDMGAGEINFFILTESPAAAFERCAAVLSRARLLDHVTVAYRSLDGEHYTVIWPASFQGEFEIA